MGAKKGRLVFDITRHEDWERREDVEIEFFFFPLCKPNLIRVLEMPKKKKNRAYREAHVIEFSPVGCGLNCVKVLLGSAMNVHARMQENGLKEKMLCTNAVRLL